MSEFFRRFSSVIKSADESEIRSDPMLQGKLRIDQSGNVVISYSPFEHIERSAKIAIVGITPGAQQASNALAEARRHLLGGKSDDEVLRLAKTHASFSGPMRTNLIEMLDYVGLNRSIGVASTGTLWAENNDLVHFTSALRYPVFVNGKNYSGQPSIAAVQILRELVEVCLCEETVALPTAVWIPLGPVATTALEHLVGKGCLVSERVIAGLPHPSGANAERIAYFVGRKARENLSPKTNAQTLDLARTQILDQVARLGCI
ncbi:hypothetical protein [Pseudolabrys sp.]|uniref:hypothetical protein n=1 Tax=Pseudolabrys sp. TaxID=1960880 RepID=UPI003D12C487